MKLRGLVDTSLLVGEFPPEILANLDSYCSSTICRSQLLQGLRVFRGDPARQQAARRREELIRLLDSIPNFWRDFGKSASDGFGQLTAQSTAALRVKDALIAGHALSLRAPVVTADAGFGRFDGIEVVLLS